MLWLPIVFVFGIALLAAPAFAGTYAYVTNESSNTVSVIDTATDTVVATVPVGSIPSRLAISPDGTRVYVVNQTSNDVSVIDTTTQTVVATVAVGNLPFIPAVSPDGARVYVGNRNDGTNSVIDTATHTVVATVAVAWMREGLAVTPDGTRVYVVISSSAVAVIDTATHTVAATVPLGSDGSVMALTPDSSLVYVAHGGTDTVSAIATTTNTVIATIPVGDLPSAMAMHPDGSRLYVMNGRDNTVSIINTATNAVIATPSLGGTYGLYVRGMAVTPDGSRVYVTNPRVFGVDTGGVSVIDTATNTTIGHLQVGNSPEGLAIGPDGARAYVTNLKTQEVYVVDIGTHTVVAIVGVGYWPRRVAVIPVVNKDPTADAGIDRTVECTSAAGASAQLDGSGSTDTDEDDLCYEWSAAGITFDDPTSATPTATFPPGPTLVTLTVTDGKGGIGVDDVRVTVVDTTPPVLLCTTDLIALWPPNHKMVLVEISLEISDVCSSPDNMVVVCKVASDEPDDGSGDGSYTGDVDGEGGFVEPVEVELAYSATRGAYIGVVDLRAERDGTQAGRTYSIVCEAEDVSGNSSTASCVVVVPHDKRKK